jgi:hypothetical protein
MKEARSLPGVLSFVVGYCLGDREAEPVISPSLATERARETNSLGNRRGVRCLCTAITDASAKSGHPGLCKSLNRSTGYPSGEAANSTN